jgi:urea transporter
VEFFGGVVNSYSQVFFSTNRFFAILLLIVSFVDPNAGLAGLISVLFINVLALGLGFNRLEIQNGLYGFNALLTGLGIGYYFQPSFEMFLVAFVSSVLVLMLTTLFKGSTAKICPAIPFNSLPFCPLDHSGIFVLLSIPGY